MGITDFFPEDQIGQSVILKGGSLRSTCGQAIGMALNRVSRKSSHHNDGDHLYPKPALYVSALY